MIIIFGTKRKRKEMGVIHLAGVCERCNNTAQRVVFSQQTWFTLFWIPVFPVSKKRYYNICVICGQANEINKEEALRV